jgi:predicted nucleotidyltransferase
VTTTDRDIQILRSFIQLKRKEQDRKLKELREQAEKDFSKILSLIINEFKPTRVYQWGSLLEGNRFQEISDIDIAVEGITDPKTFFSLYRKAQALTSFPLHLVQMETIHPEYANNIRQKGKLLYEKKIRTEPWEAGEPRYTFG